MEKILYLRERKREFNHTFECLSDDANRWSDEQSKRYKSEWEKQIRENPNYEGEPIDFFFPISTNLKNGLINNQTINKKKGYCRLLIKKKNENNTNKSIS